MPSKDHPSIHIYIGNNETSDVPDILADRSYLSKSVSATAARCLTRYAFLMEVSDGEAILDGKEKIFALIQWVVANKYITPPSNIELYKLPDKIRRSVEDGEILDTLTATMAMEFVIQALFGQQPIKLLALLRAIDAVERSGGKQWPKPA